MSFVHHCGIVHRDIKSHNVLIDDGFNAKLCDFGIAKNKVIFLIKKNELNWGSQQGRFSGTPNYMAPELFDRKSYSEKVDIFAFGTLMWEILVKKIPYDGYEVSEIIKKTTTDEKLFVPKTVSNDLANIIHACRALDPSKRPSFNDILDRLGIY